MLLMATLPQVTQRRLPLRPAHELVVARLIPGQVIAARAWRTTDEGEHVALATLRGANHVSYVALVYGEDDVVEIAGSDEDEVWSAARSVTLALDPRRPRRFYYEPPAGWSPRAIGDATVWMASTHPGRLWVWRARRQKVTAGELFAAVGMRAANPRSCAFRSTTGLDGVVVATDDAEALILSDGIYVYPLFFVGDRRIVERVVESLRPVPRPLLDGASRDALGHWE